MTTGQQLKLRGMEQAASKHAEPLHVAQSVARYLGRLRIGLVSSDDVREYMRKHNYYGSTDEELSQALGNAAGSIFAGSEWEPAGWKASERPSAHGRVIRLWRLRRA